MYSLLNYKIIYYISLSHFYVFCSYCSMLRGSSLYRCESKRKMSEFKEDWRFRVYEGQEDRFWDLRIFFDIFSKF